MPGPLTASAQYNDFKGTAAIDGINGPFAFALQEYAKLDPGYVPVGIAIYFGEPHPPAESLSDRFFSVTVLASNQVTGMSADDIREAARAGGIDVQGFRCNIGIEEFFGMVKRFHVVLGVRALEGAPLYGGNL